MKEIIDQQIFLNKLYKKILLLPFVFFLVSCATGSQIISSGDILIGMTKQELRNQLFISYPSEDPFMSGSTSKMFYKQNKEIISGSSQTVFYVFRNVTKPVKAGWVITDNGNGQLEKWFYSYIDAKNFIEKKEKTIIKTTKKTITKDKDVVDNLNKLVEEYKAGKISKEEFASKKAEILK